MALSFTAGTVALSSWGFSAGDIAVLIGAGRAAGTWLMATHEDRGFLSFLGVTPEDILRRKGFLDVFELHRRWDKELTLLQNGKRLKIQHPTQSGALVDNMDRLTWFMTLVVASLDATLESRMVRLVIQDLMLKILQERTSEGDESLIHGLPKHIEGWRSASCVRGISLESRIVWRRLLLQGKHLPGNIPENDTSEIVRLLFWIATGQDSRFATTSTDVFCLAVILAEIGLGELKTTSNINEECDESQMLVVLDMSFASKISNLDLHKWQRRRGMRIPLNDLDESVSIWGGDTSQGNLRRDTFAGGMRASNDVKLVVARKNQTIYAMDEELLDIYYIVERCTQETLPRMEKDAYRLLDAFFLASTPGTAIGLQKLVKTWPSESISKLGWWLQDLRVDRDTEEELRYLDATSTKHLASFIIFVLGYYYALLKPLVNSTQLNEQEAIGSWGWDDIQVLRVIRQFKLSADIDHEGRFARHQVLRLIGYLFTGASYADQLRFVPERSIGILGKLALVTGSLMGQADSPEAVGKFWLLDIDPSCIPSNHRGIVISGNQTPCKPTEPQAGVCSLDLSSEAEPKSDFTSHIEPDWEFDVQKVLVAYRQDGRIIHRLSPINCDIAVITSWMEPSDTTIMLIDQAIPVTLEEFCAGYIIKKNEKNPNAKIPLFAMTKSRTKARTCITGMYGANVAALSSNNLVEAAADKAPVIIIT